MKGLIHESNQGEFWMAMIARNEVAMINPQLLNLARPTLAASNETHLCVFPLHGGQRVEGQL